MKYIRLIRYQNLMLLALAQVLLRYGLFQPLGADMILSTTQFILLVLATLCIAAGGNIINDLYDLEIDRVNKPDKVLIGKSINERTANNLFFILNIIGVGIGFYLSNAIGRPGFSALFIAISALLYLYAANLKSILLVGNILVSILVAMSFIIVAIYDLLPAITPENKATQSLVFSYVLKYAFFAFFVNFIREIVKDLLDVDGDKKGGISTLPIVLGRKRAVRITFILAGILIFTVLSYMYNALYTQKAATLYFLFGIVGPLLFFCIKSWDADTKKEYRLLSAILKWVMFIGICSLLLFRFFVFE